MQPNILTHNPEPAPPVDDDIEDNFGGFRAGGSVWSGQRPQCQVCQQRDGQAIVAGLLVCGECFAEAKHETISLWRASLRLIVGGWPR